MVKNILFFGSAVEEETARNNPQLKEAANMFQHGLLRAMGERQRARKCLYDKPTFRRLIREKQDRLGQQQGPSR